MRTFLQLLIKPVFPEVVTVERYICSTYNCINLSCTTCWSGPFIYCNVIAIVVLASTFAAAAAVAAAKSLQLCPSLCDPIDGSPPGPARPGILQAGLEWVAISSSNAWKWKVKVKSLSHVRLLVTPWTAAHQAPPSMGFSRQEYWSGCYCLSATVGDNEKAI